MQKHLERPLILAVRHVELSDCVEPVKLMIALNKIIDAMNQLLPGRGSYHITDDGTIVVRNALAEQLDELRGNPQSMRQSTGRDENVPQDSDDGDSIAERVREESVDTSPNPHERDEGQD